VYSPNGNNTVSLPYGRKHTLGVFLFFILRSYDKKIKNSNDENDGQKTKHGLLAALRLAPLAAAQ
jgi:hypothetical protein